MAKKLKDSDLIAIIDREIQKASTYNTKISRDRALAIKYYNQQPFGNEKKGRSSYVSSEVQETISWILPQVMKVFSENDVVQFDSSGPGQQEAAELATEYCKYIIYKKNPGFLVLHNFFLDAFLQKNGTVKISYDKTPVYKRDEYKGLSDIQLAQLLQDPNIEPIEHDVVDGPLDPKTNEPTQLHDVTVKVKQSNNSKIKIENVPPEEIIVSNLTRSINLNGAPFVAHRCKKTISWLRTQGWKIPDDIQDDTAGNVEYSQERVARYTVDGNYGVTYGMTSETPVDPTQREVWVVEAYFKCDFNNDGIAEIRKVTKVGSKVLENEEVFSQPFISTSPFPQSHKYSGLSMADVVKDLQLLKSMLMRAILDSFAFNINPSKAIDVTKVVDINDLLDTNPGNYIRMRGDTNNAFYSMPSTSVGQDAFSLLGYIDDIAESRSGVSKMTQGIDQNVFNKTATGTAAIMNASQEKIALIVRIFAETGISEIYKKIIELASNYADGPELIQINSEFAQVDPRQWTDLDSLTICVGTGSLDKQVELQNVNQLIQLQQTLAQLPIAEAKALVGPDKFYNSLATLTKAMGFKDVSQFFNSPSSQEYAMVLQHAQQQMQPPPDPNMVLAEAQQGLTQVKAQEVQIDAQNKQQDLYLKQQELDLKKSIEQDKASFDRQEAQLKYELELAKMSTKAFTDMFNSMETQVETIGEGGVPALPALPGQLELLRKMVQPQYDPRPDQINEHVNNLHQHMANMADQVSTLTKHITSPKVIVRDQFGKAQGIANIDGSSPKVIKRDEFGRAQGITDMENNP